MYTEQQIAKWVALQTEMDVLKPRIAASNRRVHRAKRRYGVASDASYVERDALSTEFVRLMGAYYDGFTATDYSGCNTAARLDLMAAYRKANGLPVWRAV